MVYNIKLLLAIFVFISLYCISASATWLDSYFFSILYHWHYYRSSKITNKNNYRGILQFHFYPANYYYCCYFIPFFHIFSIFFVFFAYTHFIWWMCFSWVCIFVLFFLYRIVLFLLLLCFTLGFNLLMAKEWKKCKKDVKKQ